jgi:ribosomal protein S18 acetylase RimI-like enzyme
VSSGCDRLGRVTATLPLRAATSADAGSLLDLVTAMDLAETGESECTLTDVLDDFAQRVYRAWLHDAADGRVDGGVWVSTFPGEDSVIGNVLQDPASGSHLLAPLLEVARQQARELDPTLPFHVSSYTTSKDRIAALEAAGGVIVRYFWRMTAALTEGLPAVELPTGASIRVIDEADAADLRTMYDVLETAFVDHFGAAPATYDEWLGFRSSSALSDRSLWWLATIDGEPAAALIGRRMGDMGWIEEVGTLPGYRSRGLARALLVVAFEEFRRLGYVEVGLGVDATNPTGAVRLYSSIGMRQSRTMPCYEFRS